MSRESALSRLAEARGYAARIVNSLDDTIELFLDSSEDPHKHERSLILDSIIEDSGNLSRVVEEVQDEGFDFDDVLDDDDDEEGLSDDDDDSEYLLGED